MQDFENDTNVFYFTLDQFIDVFHHMETVHIYRYKLVVFTKFYIYYNLEIVTPTYLSIVRFFIIFVIKY